MAKRKLFEINSDFQSALSDTMTSAKTNAGSLRLEIIAIKDIEFDPKNPRKLVVTREDLPDGPNENDPLYETKIKEIEELQSIASSIEEHGLLNAIVVYQYGDKYRLIAGERRCLASILAGKTEIKASVSSSVPSELKNSILQWIENVERRDLKLSERVYNLEKIIDAYKKENNISEEITPALIKKLLNCSWVNASDYHAVLSADGELKLAIQENKIRNLEKAAYIFKAKSSILKSKLLEACIGGYSLKQLKEMGSLKNLKDQLTDNITPVKRKPGKQATRVKLGFIKNPKAAEKLIKIILADQYFQEFREKFSGSDWNNYDSLSKIFETILKIVEKKENN